MASYLATITGKYSITATPVTTSFTYDSEKQTFSPLTISINGNVYEVNHTIETIEEESTHKYTITVNNITYTWDLSSTFWKNEIGNDTLTLYSDGIGYTSDEISSKLKNYYIIYSPVSNANAALNLLSVDHVIQSANVNLFNLDDITVDQMESIISILTGENTTSTSET